MSAPTTIEPCRAPVRPRASLYPGGEVLALESQIERLLKGKRAPLVNIFGPFGSDKTTALRHLTAVFSPDEIQVLDEFMASADVVPAANDRLLIITTETRLEASPVALELAHWQQDDLIEYMLASRRDKCKSVMQRIQKAEKRGSVLPLPELWAVVLEEFAADEALADIGEAFRRYLERRLGERYHEACSYSLEAARVKEGPFPKPAPIWNVSERLLRHDLPLAILAAERLSQEVAAGNYRALEGHLPKEIISHAQRHFPPPYQGLRGLSKAILDDLRLQPTGTTLLLAANPGWRPEGRLKHLSHADLAGAQWRGVQLLEAVVRATNFSRANLEEANLQSAEATGAAFRQARLVNADLRKIQAKEADFTGANMTGARCQSAIFEDALLNHAALDMADLRGANLLRAKLFRARLVRAMLHDAMMAHINMAEADLSYADCTRAMFGSVSFLSATLAGASFRRASLMECNLEEVEFPQADFEEAILTGSYFTASIMPSANFRGASLRNAGLAEVQWENADLRDADFRGATFHMGSSRSGLVNSVIASEGSRTGFYTDDYNDQDYKAPEEIRKANLCGADLRGALVEKTDFYLVDLRRAKYSEDQGRHFAQCGAILHDRMPRH